MRFLIKLERIMGVNSELVYIENRLAIIAPFHVLESNLTVRY